MKLKISSTRAPYFYFRQILFCFFPNLYLVREAFFAIPRHLVFCERVYQIHPLSTSAALDFKRILSVFAFPWQICLVYEPREQKTKSLRHQLIKFALYFFLGAARCNNSAALLLIP